MPSTPPRRRMTRRVAPPRPTYGGAAAPVAEAPEHITRQALRPTAYVAREAVNVKMELKRVVGVSATCFGLLAVLAIIDRVR
ncbi:MAG: hypothetical protein EPO65_00735 [Dehalococcoidia bacterium]|nr:MAG: hypothetical protein EPO65_00735 [Dehalococcoidia bacterium]